MTVTRENTEIFDHPHQMYAEGVSDEKPNETDIQILLSSEGWVCDEIDIWEDVSQGVYRWDCKISKP